MPYEKKKSVYEDKKQQWKKNKTPMLAENSYKASTTAKLLWFF